MSKLTEVSPPALTPPKAKQIPRTISAHRITWQDEFFWLRRKEDPEVIAYLESENAHTDLVMKNTQALQEKLYNEMLGRIKETDLSVPVKIDGYFYYSRTEQGKQYPIQCRKLGSLEAQEEMILDPNELAAGRPYFQVGISKISPDHRFLAYSTDTAGSEDFTLFVKDMKTGEHLPEKITGTYPSLEWAADSRTLFYLRLDPTRRPFQVRRHQLGSNPDRDQLVFEEPDEAFFLSLYKTKDRRFLVLDLSSKDTSEQRWLLSDDPEAHFAVVQPREKGIEYSIEHREGYFFILTNDKAKNFRMVKTPVSASLKSNWQEVIAGRAGALLEGLEIFQDYLVVVEREKGLRKIRIQNWKTETFHYVSIEEPIYTLSLKANPEYPSRSLRFEYASLKTPHCILDYDMESRKREIKKQQEVLGGYDPGQYISERIWAKSHDGVQVPVSLVYRKGIRRDGSSPLLLYGYGSYGIPVEPGFSSSRLSLLDRGFIFAIAHVRGGGELGRPWYESGKLRAKKNTFYDFIAAAERLIEEKYTAPDKLVISGGSAGGLLMGAVINMRPELFHGVIAEVPFVDVLNTMLDDSLPLTVTEFDEWGNPAEKEFFDLLRSYSPYENVRSQKYPHLLATGGLHDPRVQYWEPAKWVARLRKLKTDRNLLLLKMQMAGHGGPSGRYEALKDLAFRYAFILMILEKVEKGEPPKSV